MSFCLFRQYHANDCANDGVGAGESDAGELDTQTRRRALARRATREPRLLRRRAVDVDAPVHVPVRAGGAPATAAHMADATSACDAWQGGAQAAAGAADGARSDASQRHEGPGGVDRGITW